MDRPDLLLDFAGTKIPARIGESLAAALMRAGQRGMRHLPDGTERGMFCGMGVCQDCVLMIDGVAGRSCMTAISGPHRLVPTGELPEAAEAPLPPIDIADVPVLAPQVLVIGGGAAGLSAAAAAAESGASVMLVDERTRLGGQFFKQPAPGVTWRDDAQFAGGRALIARARRAGVRIVKGDVWGAFAPRDLAVIGPDGLALYRPDALIVATGAFERSLAFPGWTLPGVMTTGAAQTLLRGEGVIAGQRVLVAGNGPLNLQVAVELARHGAKVAAVVEWAPHPGLAQVPALWRIATTSPSLLRQGAALHRERWRNGIPMLYGQALHRVQRGPDGLHATVTPPGSDTGHDFEVDIVCTGYGFQPANDILRALGCRHVVDAPRDQLVTLRDLDGATSIAGVYAAGDCCGLGGAPAAIEEGRLAGWAAAAVLGHMPDPAQARAARRSLARHRRFQSGLWQLYAAPKLTTERAGAETAICRCENVTLAALQAAIADGRPSIGEIKRRTRLGMGACQGRYCAPVLAAMLVERDGRQAGEFSLFAPQAPIKPIAIAALSRPSATMNDGG